MFFEAYQKLRQTDTGLNALEQGALRSLLPPLKSKRILDLGCGFGDFSKWAEAQGAKSVLGIDVSERMVDSARSTNSSPRISFQHIAVEDFDGGSEHFDVVVSS